MFLGGWMDVVGWVLRTADRSQNEIKILWMSEKTR